jgi:hypothetical protein
MGALTTIPEKIKIFLIFCFFFFFFFQKRVLELRVNLEFINN